LKYRELKYNSALIDQLKESALSSFRQGHYFQSGIILFQTVEVLLRICVSGLGRTHGVAASVLKECASDEISFRRLTLYLDLVSPQNGLGDRLRQLNTKRNAFVHEAFYQSESIDALNTRLEQFCVECVDLNAELRKLIGV
jgi:hypothetical protein